MKPAVVRRISKQPGGYCTSRHAVLIVLLFMFVWLPLKEENKWLVSTSSTVNTTGANKKDRQRHNPSTLPPIEKHQCSHYNGILHVQHGDYWAAGTAMFFCYIINHLLFAEEHNLMPWIHLDEYSERIYDVSVHGQGPSRSFQVPSRLQVTYDCGEDQICEPIEKSKRRTRRNETITVHGNGVWESYFEPVSTFSLDNNPCFLPYLSLTEDDLARMHYGWLPSVRAWHYIESVRPKPKPGHLHEWYGAMRVRGASIVQKYYRPKPWLVQAIENANPSQQCLSMHVRFTDKSGGRDMIGVSEYRPYAVEYAKAVPNGAIYLASDSSNTYKQIQQSWPPDVMERIIMQPSVLHSSNETGVFDIGSHHRTNSDVLTDVYAMAKCSVFLHGHSSVSESVVYVNLHLHNCSVDLEDSDRPTVKEFRNMVGGDHPTCR